MIPENNRWGIYVLSKTCSGQNHLFGQWLNSIHMFRWLGRLLVSASEYFLDLAVWYCSRLTIREKALFESLAADFGSPVNPLEKWGARRKIDGLAGFWARKQPSPSLRDPPYVQLAKPHQLYPSLHSDLDSIAISQFTLWMGRQQCFILRPSFLEKKTTKYRQQQKDKEKDFS